MPKVRTSLVIIGIIIAMLAASALTLLGLSLAGVIVTEKPVLEFTVDAVDAKEYDGTPLKATRYSWASGANELKEGHYVEGRILGEQTNYGTSETDLRVKVYDAKKRDVTNDYSIKINNTELKVVPRNITIILEGQQVPYSGDEVFLEAYSVLEGATDFDSSGQTSIDFSKFSPKELAPGDRLAISFPGFMNVVDELPAFSEWSPDNFRIYNEKGELVNNNYHLTWASFGKVEIVPRKLGVKAFDVKKEYDGTPIEASFQHVWGPMVGNDFIYGVKFVDESDNEVNLSDIVTVQDKKVKISELVLYKQDGYNVVPLSADEAKNYELDESYIDYVTLSIEKRTIEVQAKDVVKSYDGHPLLYSWNKVPFYTVSGLPSQFKLTAESSEGDDIVGVYDGIYSMDKFTVKLNDEVVTDQFEINTRSAIARITPLIIRSSLHSCSKDYTGSEIEVPISEAVGDEFGEIIEKYFVDHAGVLPEIQAAIRKLKDADTYFQVVCAQKIKNAGEYEFTLVLSADGLTAIKNVSNEDNIKIEFTSAKMTVDRATISVAYMDKQGTVTRVTKTYDGKPVEFDAGNLMLDSGENLSVHSADFRYYQGGVAHYGNHALVGEYTVAIRNVSIIHREDETTETDVTQNYKITTPQISVIIEKAKIKLVSRTPMQTVVSSKTPRQLAGDLEEIILGTIEFEGLAGGDVVSDGCIRMDYDANDVAGFIEYSVIVEFTKLKIVNNGTDVTNCYEFVGLNQWDTTVDPVAVVYVLRSE